MANGMESIARALDKKKTLQAGAVTPGGDVKSTLTGAKQGLQGIATDDNTKATPQANAEDIDMVIFTVMIMIDLFNVMWDRVMGVETPGAEMPPTAPPPAPITPPPTTPPTTPIV